jgi:hypothetical protein
MSTPEGKVKDLLKRRFRAAFPSVYLFMPVQNGLGAPALDFYGIVDGFAFAIETKKPGGKLTSRQEITKQTIEAAGAFV